jgi:hypothetical protein
MFTRRAIALLLTAAFGLSLVAEASAADELRTWTDKTGKHKIEARLKAIVDGKAVLIKADGKEMKIDVAKLSAADQKFLKDNPPADDDNPFESSDTPSSTKPSGGEPTTESKKLKIDWTDVQALALAPSGEGWKFPVPIPPAVTEPLKPKAIAVPPKSNFFEALSGMVVNHDSTKALLAYTLGEPKPEGVTRIVLADLKAGKVLTKYSTKGVMAPVALSDDGTQALMRRADWGWGNSDRLEIWKLSSAGVQKVLECFPNDDAQGGGRDVKWGAYLADNRFILMGGNGRLAVWKANAAAPEYSLQIDGGSGPAITPDRKYVAFSTGQQIGVLNVEAGEVAAIQSAGHLPFGSLCFSPDASKLACMAHGKLLVWNFADGTLYREIPLAGINISGPMIWPHPQYMLMGKSVLFDVENQVPMWSYTGADAAEVIAPGQCLFSTSAGTDKPGALVMGNVPNATFEKALADAKKQPDFLILKPGVTVKLNVDALPDPQEREKVRQALTQKLKDRGCSAGPNGTIELVATAQAGEERDVSYHGFGVSPWKTHKVREYISKLVFSYQGKVAWQSQGSSVPGFIQLKEGETIDQVLRRSERPNYTFYEHVELPKVLMKPNPMGTGLGSSQVSTAGVQ